MGTKSPLSFLVATSKLEIHIINMGTSTFSCGPDLGGGARRADTSCSRNKEACCEITEGKFECKKKTDASASGCFTQSRALDDDQFAGILDNVFNSKWANDE